MVPAICHEDRLVNRFNSRDIDSLTLREAVARCQTSCLTISTFFSGSPEKVIAGRKRIKKNRPFFAGGGFEFFCLRSDWLLSADAGSRE